MRIAFTGASSTGKTTLSNHIQADTRLFAAIGPFVTTDARRLLRELGYENIDSMSLDARIRFQFAYLERKLALESELENFFTDRSFVDLAAYWLQYTGRTLADGDEYVARCRTEVGRYGAHFYFPSELLPLKADGWRSAETASRERTDGYIRAILDAWGVSAVALNELDLDLRRERVAEVLAQGAG